jgi:7-carboxy-7-deazaguanine synthase
MRVTEIFKSIQGESSRAGLPCAFVRLTGCNLRCVWCDSKYTFEGGTDVPIDAIVETVTAMRVKRVEVTGGEPMIQAETPELCRRFLDLGFEVLIETGGSISLATLDRRVIKIVDVKCPGSGMEPRNFPGIEKQLDAKDEIKFVIAGRADFDWAIAWVQEHKMEAWPNFLFAPVWESCPPADLAAWLLDSGLDARLNLQQHKVLWGDVPGR